MHIAIESKLWFYCGHRLKTALTRFDITGARTDDAIVEIESQSPGRSLRLPVAMLNVWKQAWAARKSQSSLSVFLPHEI
jgi:hypothetical protein